MSDTPETDHLEDQLGSAAKFAHPIIWRHARDLERERDEAREDLEFRRGLYKVQEQHLETARRERDEAREAFKSFNHDKKHLCDSHRDMNGNCIVCRME